MSFRFLASYAPQAYKIAINAFNSANDRVQSSHRIRRASASVQVFICPITLLQSIKENAVLTLPFMICRFVYAVGPDTCLKILCNGNLPGVEPSCCFFHTVPSIDISVS